MQRDLESHSLRLLVSSSKLLRSLYEVFIKFSVSLFSRTVMDGCFHFTDLSSRIFISLALCDSKCSCLCLCVCVCVCVCVEWEGRGGCVCGVRLVTTFKTSSLSYFYQFTETGLVLTLDKLFSQCLTSVLTAFAHHLVKAARNQLNPGVEYETKNAEASQQWLQMIAKKGVLVHLQTTMLPEEVSQKHVLVLVLVVVVILLVIVVVFVVVVVLVVLVLVFFFFSRMEVGLPLFSVSFHSVIIT